MAGKLPARGMLWAGSSSSCRPARRAVASTATGSVTDTTGCCQRVPPLHCIISSGMTRALLLGLCVAMRQLGVSVAQVMPPDKDELAGVVKAWVGNTWDGAEGGVTNSSQWVPISMDGFFVKENDGSLYGATMWDEGGHESSTWSADGDMLGACVDTHGWARGGGQDITADDDFIYSSQRQAPCGDGVFVGNRLQRSAGPCTWVGGATAYPDNKTWYTVRRYKNQPGYPADNVSKSGGAGVGYDSSMTVIATIPWDTAHKQSDTSILTGLAVGGGFVAVSDNLTDTLHVLDSATMGATTHKKYPLANPSRLAFDTKRKHFWHATRSPSEAKNDTVSSIDPSTGETGRCQITSVVRAMSLSYHQTTDSLLIGEGGVRQLVLIFDAATCALRETVGAEGGVFSGSKPGAMAPLRFYGVTGAGMDSKGALYVVSGGGRAEKGDLVTGGGTNLVKLTRDNGVDGTGWQLVWQRLGLTFTDMAGLDPRDPGHMYSRNYKFKTNFSAPAGQGNFFEPEGYTLDPFLYPDDPRFHLDPTEMTIRQINNPNTTAGGPVSTTIMYGWDMYASFMAGWRFTPTSDIAIPCVLWGRAVASQHQDPPPWPSVEMGAKNYSDWVWADANDDGVMQPEEFAAVEHSLNGWAWAIDSAGAVWQGFNFETYMPGNGHGWGGVNFGGNDTMSNHTTERYQVTGLTAGGVPLYSTKDTSGFSGPLPTAVPRFSQCFGPCNNGRVDYDVAKDRMILSSFTEANPDTGHQWGQVGTEACVYRNWSAQASTSTYQEDFCVLLPYIAGGGSVGAGTQVKAIKVVDNYLFAVEGTQAGVLV
jgi:hypothetical protein